MPDTVSLIIWLIAGIAGGFAVGDLVKRDIGLHDPLQNAVAGVVGGVIGSGVIWVILTCAITGVWAVPVNSR